MAAEEERNGKDRPRGFYSRALDVAEQIELEEASHVEGLDEEIAYSTGDSVGIRDDARDSRGGLVTALTAPSEV